MWRIIKIEPLQPKEYTVTLTKTSADVSITQGNSAYSLAGATYNVYEGTSGTGSVVATFTTDEAGHATLSTPLEDGTYSVKEVTPPKGYKLDTKVYTFTIGAWRIASSWNPWRGMNLTASPPTWRDKPVTAGARASSSRRSPWAGACSMSTCGTGRIGK